jgi:hypothetical protein
MDNYVQQMWQDHNAHQNSGKATRVFAWIIGVAVVVSAAAYISQSYWYPYVSPYL